jgi:hypothetical protein
LKHFLFLLLLSTLFVSCKKNQTATPEVVNDNSEVIEIEKEFVDFYNKFHTDSDFQLNSINFPLHAEGDSITWTAENWVIHKPFDDYGGKFRREFNPAGRLVLERIYDANGFFNMHRRWANLSDGWKLIYYKIDEFKPPAGAQ